MKKIFLMSFLLLSFSSTAFPALETYSIYCPYMRTLPDPINGGNVMICASGGQNHRAWCPESEYEYNNGGNYCSGGWRFAE